MTYEPPMFLIFISYHEESVIATKRNQRRFMKRLSEGGDYFAFLTPSPTVNSSSKSNMAGLISLSVHTRDATYVI